MKNTVIKIDNLSVNYGDYQALRNISLEISEGEYVGIIGPNGSGKSTLLKSMLGLIKPNSGKIEMLGQMPGDTGKLVGYVPQISNMNKHFPITVGEVVALGKLPSKIEFFHHLSKSDYSMADEMLGKVGLYDLKDRHLSELSGGQFQKVLIARALVVNPKILLLDEPTASVDSVSRNQIFMLLESLNAQMTIVLVTHDMTAIATQVKTLACLNVNLVYHGEPELTENAIRDLYGCPVDLLAHGLPHRVMRDHLEEK